MGTLKKSMEINIWHEFPPMKAKTLKSMKNYGTKSEILLGQKLITHTIMMKKTWKSKLIQMMIYF